MANSTNNTITFEKFAVSSNEQQIGFSSEPRLPSVKNTGALELYNALYAPSILSAARSLKTYPQLTSPVVMGRVTINGFNCGNFEYRVAGTTTISSFSDSDWFTSTEDSVSSWILINGDLTINAGQVFQPTKRKLFTVVYVSGNLTLNGNISMSARGANHSGGGNSGGYTAPVPIQLAVGSFSCRSYTSASGFVTNTQVNPTIPAGGGSGAAIKNSGSGLTTGGSGPIFGTGGGGGGNLAAGSGTVGAGSSGTCFTGGSGSGQAWMVSGTGVSGSGVANGGAGGVGTGPLNVTISNGGAGNPGGAGYYFGSEDARCKGTDGTGGMLIIICEGTLSGTGKPLSQGQAGGSFGGSGGGGSGGGAYHVFYGTNSSTFNENQADVGSLGNGGYGSLSYSAIGAN